MTVCTSVWFTFYKFYIWRVVFILLYPAIIIFQIFTIRIFFLVFEDIIIYLKNRTRVNINIITLHTNECLSKHLDKSSIFIQAKVAYDMWCNITLII